ncbi:AMP-binding protein [Nocardia sp. 004]|uniref:AMP-binding protein n=1 Tax=Nocardia sp. 004 TaxID=3385978 RepID=UPI0039A22D06
MTTPIALTAAQRGIVDAQRLWPDSRAFLLAEYLALHGPVDPTALAEAIRRMITDVQAQRIRLIHTEHGPHQIIGLPDEVPVTVHDLTQLADPHAEAMTIMRADLDTPSDPHHGVTTHHRILVLDNEQVYWYHRAHHIALDGYGFALCARRVADHYRAGTGDTVPPLTHSLTDVIADDTAYHGSTRCAEDGTHWRTTLTGRSAPTLTATPHPPTIGTHRTRRPLTSWQPAPRTRIDIAESILAAVAIYLARRTGERDVALGVPMMNRIGSPAATVPCMVLNAIALPVRVDPDETIAELTTRIGAELRTARRHARYRHERLRAELGLIGGGRSLLGPMVNIMPFDYDLGLPGIQVRAHNLSAGPVEDLSINLYLRTGTAELVLDANPHCYTPRTLDQHADALHRTITEAGTDSTRLVRDIGVTYLPIQTPADTQVGDPITRMRTWADTDPQAPALLDDDHLLSRAELLALATTRAAELIDRGVTATDIVAILPCGDGADIVSILAIQLAGAAHIALDPTLPVGDLHTLVDTIAPTAIIHPPHHAALARAIAPGSTAMIAATAPNPKLLGNHTPIASRRGAGYAVLTSGSTGKPKAVRVGGAALAAFVTDAIDRYQWQPDDRVIQFGPLHADTSIEEIFVTLAAGACVVTARPADRQAPVALLALAQRTRATVFDLPTAVWHELALAVDTDTAHLPTTVRRIVIGGEEASPELVARWLQHGGPVLHNSYGPSEAAVVCASTDIASAHDPAAPVPLGPLFPHAGAILAVDHLEPADHDHDDPVGYLHLYGPMLAEGYLPATAGTGFRTTRIADRTVRTFATGDRVRVRADGVLEFIERDDGVIKIGGQRIGLRVIEDLLRREPGVRDALITRRGEFAFDALVTVDRPHTPEWFATMRQQLATQLPAAWVPARIIAVDRIPRTRNLKADRTALIATETIAQPDVEHILRVFHDILGHDELTADEDFFAAGGTSMQTLALANRLTLATGHTVTVDEILARPNAAELAAHLHRPDRTDTDHPGHEKEITALRATLSSLTPSAPPATNRILLTGATGFFGAYLLAELLAATDHDVTVLVRAESTEHAEHRLRTASATESAAHHLRSALASHRLSVALGDCATTEFATELDTRTGIGHIVHSAAVISAVRSYQSLRSVNVAATHHLLRIARTCDATLTLISTATAAGPRGTLADPAALPTGYAQSKSVAEHLLTVAAAEFGIPTTIARVGRILPHPADPRDLDHDFLHELATAATAIGSLPHTEVREPMVRADIAAKIITAAIGTDPTPRPRVLDLLTPEPVALADVLPHLTGTRMPTIPLDHWRDSIDTCQNLAPPLRAAVIRWCDIQLAGFDRDWVSDHTTPTPDLSATEAATLLRRGGGNHRTAPQGNTAPGRQRHP